VMNNTEGVGHIQKGGKDPFANKRDSYKKLANLMTKMWSSFMHRLDPIGSGGMLNSSGEIS
jgi:hypothetical protein